MKHLLSEPALFKSVNDPYNNGRICFQYEHLDKAALNALLNDPKFLFCNHSIIYFSA